MVEFLQEHFMLVIIAVVVVVFAVKAYRLIQRANKIEKEGLEVDAVVSRVDFDFDPDNNGSYFIYVNYRDDRGQERESCAGIFVSPEYDAGEEVRIRFIPGEYDMVRIMKDK